MENTSNIQFKTRNHTLVHIERITEHGSIQGHYLNGETWVPATWNSDGNFSYDGSEHPLDIRFDNTEINDAVGYA